MSMACPECRTVHEQRLHCPRCGARLVYIDPRAQGGGGAAGKPRGPRWQQTPWGRVLIGLALAQGLFYGLWQLITGVMLAVLGDRAPIFWAAPEGKLLVQGVQLFSLAVGGLMTGGGQRQGLVLGAVVGGWNGVLSGLLQQIAGWERTPDALAGQAMLHATIAAVTGWVGSLIWKPIPVASAGVVPQQRKGPARRWRPLLDGKVSWLRVLLGSALAVAGMLSAAFLFEKLLEVGGGKLGTTHELQDRLIIWEIRAFALLLGGIIAGSNTANGIKQGFLVGVFVTLALAGILGQQGGDWLEVAALTAASALPLGVAGGWFGAQLLPPLVKMSRKGLGPMG